MYELLNKEEARALVEKYVANEDKVISTQELIDLGAIPRLEGYTVRPGKVSDSIFGGKGNFYDKKTNTLIEFENPPLNTSEGIPIRLMIRTARISTHDVIRGDVPFKDQILAANHNFMRRLLKQFIGTSQFEIDGLADNAIVIAAEDLKQIPFENVLRAYMAKSSTTTSLYQHFIKGQREFCGHILPEGLIANGKLPYIMDTPSTKSDDHDESVSPRKLYDMGVCTPAQYAQIRNGSIAAFGAVSMFLGERGLIAVDTKTEHGINHLGQIVSQDEIWTMDSSRFWMTNDYDIQLRELNLGMSNELNPKSYSKEFARGFSEGDKGYTPEQRILIAARYIEGIQNLLGKRFEPDLRPRTERLISGIETILKELDA